MTEVEVQQKEREERQRQMIVACSEVFKGKNGKLVLDWLERECGWNASVIRRFDPVDPMEVAFYEGKRDVFGRLRIFLNAEVKDV